MLTEKDLRNIAKELLKFNSGELSYLDAIDLIFDSIEVGVCRTEPSASDVYEEIIKKIIYGNK